MNTESKSGRHLLAFWIAYVIVAAVRSWINVEVNGNYDGAIGRSLSFWLPIIMYGLFGLLGATCWTVVLWAVVASARQRCVALWPPVWLAAIGGVASFALGHVVRCKEASGAIAVTVVTSSLIGLLCALRGTRFPRDASTTARDTQ